MSSASPAGLGAAALCEALARGRWTSVALTEHFLARIGADTLTRAVCTPEVERARRDAAASDARRAAGAPLGPLDGLPMTLKDAVRLGGSRTTWGVWPYRNHRPRRSSAAVAALEAEGVVVLGRTGVPTGSFDWNGRNGLFPEVRNPLDPARSPGGSSAGAAAAVAGGLAPLDIGSDLGGSIRVPCAFCGLAGLRTTDGWVPVDDLGPEGLPPSYAHLVTLGPIARAPADLLPVLDAWARAFPAPEVPLGDGPVAVSRAWGGLRPEPATERALDAWLERFPNVVEAAPDLDPDALLRDWGLISGFEFARGLPWYGRPAPARDGWFRFAIRARLGDGPFTRAFGAGMRARPAEHAAALERRHAVHAVADAFFARHALWALPVAPGPAEPLADAGRAVDGVPYVVRLGTWNAPTALLGTPALALPLPGDGLPRGVQVHGPRFSDRALVRAFPSPDAR